MKRKRRKTKPYTKVSTMVLYKKDCVGVPEFARRFKIDTNHVYHAVNRGKFVHARPIDGHVGLHWEHCSKEFMSIYPGRFEPDPETGFFREVAGKSQKKPKVDKTKKTKHEETNEEHDSPPADCGRRKRTLHEDQEKEMFSLADAKRDKEYYSSKRERLRYEEEAGELLHAEEVRREWEYIAINLQKSMMSISDRVCSLIAGEINYGLEFFLDILANEKIQIEVYGRLLDANIILKMRKALEEKTKELSFNAAKVRDILDAEIRYSLEHAIPDDEQTENDNREKTNEEEIKTNEESMEDSTGEDQTEVDD